MACSTGICSDTFLINLVPFIMVKADSAVGIKSLIRSPLPSSINPAIVG